MDNCNKSVLCHRPHYYYSSYAAPPHHGYDDRHHHHLDHSPSHDRPHGSSSHGHYPYYYGQSVPPAPDYPGSRSTKMDKSLCLPSLQSTPTPMPTLSSTLSSPAAATGEGTAKPPPRTWKKPLGKPKRPLSAYNYFFQHHRSVVIDALKKKAILEAAEEAAAESSGKKKKKKRRQRRSRGIGVGFAELAREVAFEWKKLEAEGKKEYEEQARLDKERYDKELDAWTLKVEKEELEREETERRQGEEQQQLALEEAQDEEEKARAEEEKARAEEEKARAEEEKAKVVMAVRVESFDSSFSMHNKSLLMADRIESFGSAYSMTSIRRSVIMAERVTSFGTNGGYNCLPHHHLTRSVVLADRIESFSGRNIVIPQDRRHPYHAHGEVEDEEDEEEAEAYAYENHNPYDDKHACEDHKGGDGSDEDSNDHCRALSSSTTEQDRFKIARPEQCGLNSEGGKTWDCSADSDKAHYEFPRSARYSGRRDCTSYVRNLQHFEEKHCSSPQYAPSILWKRSTYCDENVNVYPIQGSKDDIAPVIQGKRERSQRHSSLTTHTADVSEWAEVFFDVASVVKTQKMRPSASIRAIAADDKARDDADACNYKTYPQNKEKEAKPPPFLVAASFSSSSSRPLCSRCCRRDGDNEERELISLLPVSPQLRFHSPTEVDDCHSSYRYSQGEHWGKNENTAPFVTPPSSMAYHRFSPSPSSPKYRNHPYHVTPACNEPKQDYQRHGLHGEHKVDKKCDCDSEKGMPLPYLPTWTDKKCNY